MLGNLINVKHRHIVFTIPEELRKFFGIDRQGLRYYRNAQLELLRVGCIV